MKIEDFKHFEPVKGLTYLNAEIIRQRLTKEKEELFEGLLDRVEKRSSKALTKEEIETFETLTSEELTILCYEIGTIANSHKTRPHLTITS